MERIKSKNLSPHEKKGRNSVCISPTLHNIPNQYDSDINMIDMQNYKIHTKDRNGIRSFKHKKTGNLLDKIHSLAYKFEDQGTKNIIVPNNTYKTDSNDQDEQLLDESYQSLSEYQNNSIVIMPSRRSADLEDSNNISDSKIVDTYSQKPLEDDDDEDDDEGEEESQRGDVEEDSMEEGGAIDVKEIEDDSFDIKNGNERALDDESNISGDDNLIVVVQPNVENVMKEKQLDNMNISKIDRQPGYKKFIGGKERNFLFKNNNCNYFRIENVARVKESNEIEFIFTNDRRLSEVGNYRVIKLLGA